MRTKTMTEARARWLMRAGQEGATFPQAREILRHAKTLQRCAEEACGDGSAYANWAREDCDKCGGSHLWVYPHHGERYMRAGKTCESDRTRFSERRAQDRIAVIAAMFGAVARFSGDPRGCVVSLCWPSWTREPSATDPDNGRWEGVPS